MASSVQEERQGLWREAEQIQNTNDFFIHGSVYLNLAGKDGGIT